MTTLKNLRIYLPNQMIEKGYIVFDHVIREIGTGDVNGIDMDHQILIPGFIDQHIHGVYGYDAMDAINEAYKKISEMLPKEGTTSFLATTMTDSSQNIIEALKHMRSYHENDNQKGAHMIGIHLEGPFISPVFKGAQREDAIILPSIEQFELLNKASGNLIKLVTLAPELEGAYPLISYLKNQNIVASIGHSNASDQHVIQALNLGASCFTHGYNAMSRLHHRDLGVVGMMLLDNQSYAEIICDGIHTSELAIQLLYKNKTSRHIILVTDAMRAKLLDEGIYALGGQKVTVKDHQARLSDGTLAGSVLKMIDAVKKMKQITQCSLEDIIQMASYNPAKLLKIDHIKGSIAVGMDADFIVMDDSLNIQQTYCRGQKQ